MAHRHRRSAGATMQTARIPDIWQDGQRRSHAPVATRRRGDEEFLDALETSTYRAAWLMMAHRQA